jgi:FtsP/CotA-like multicopper oxidase with cupredoxin domain
LLNVIPSSPWFIVRLAKRSALYVPSSYTVLVIYGSHLLEHEDAGMMSQFVVA